MSKNVQSLASVIGSVDQMRRTIGVAAPVQQVRDAVAVARRDAVAAGKEEGYAMGFAQGNAEGFRKGRDRGLVAAHEEGERALNSILKQIGHEIQGVRDELELTIARYFADLEERATELTMDAVRKLISHELATDRSCVKAIVSEALREVTHSSQARIRINPKDAPMLAAERDRLLNFAANLRGIEFIADPTIMAGCIIETEGGTVVATVENRLEILETEVEEAA